MVSIYKKQLSDNQKHIVYQKTNGICIVCGKKVSDDMQKWSVEHYIPRAIYKWIPTQSLRDILESESNWFIVHKNCNIKKDADLPTIKSIQNLPVDNRLKVEMVQLYRSVENELSQYRAIKQSVLAGQNYKCLFCNRHISLLQATLRRKDNRRARLADNAMCLCFTCSVRAGNPSYKRKMVKKVT